MRKICSALATWLLLSAAAAMAEPFKCQVDSEGKLVVDSLRLDVAHYDMTSSYNPLPLLAAPAANPLAVAKSQTIKGELSCVLTETDKESSSLFIALKSENQVPTKELALRLPLPVEDCAGHAISLDGKKLILPKDFDKWTLAETPGAFSLEIEMPSRKLVFQGQGGVEIIDTRKFNASYEVRFTFSPSQGNLTESSLSLAIGAKGYDAKSLDLRGSANRAFHDADGNGWTGQGSENDLGMFRPGLNVFGGIPFQIVDERKNGGKACIGLAGEREGFAKSARIDAAGASAKRLYLLHALAWAPNGKVEAGELKINYMDGSSSVRKILSGVEVSDWWNPASVPNGRVAWTGENKQAFVGLYLSGFDIEPKAVGSVELTGTSDAVWLIAGAALSNETPPQIVSSPTYILPSGDWRPFTLPADEILAGSALDFSNLLDAPAGKKGKTIVKNGKFAFEGAPEAPVRFQGCNVWSSNAGMFTHERAEKMADAVARAGYNAARLHPFDGAIVKNASDGALLLDEEAMERFDYLFNCFKARGVYLTIDLMVMRLPKKGEIPGLAEEFSDFQSFKQFILISREGRENWKLFSKNLLTHVNPYTGMAWKDDPALISISLINEGNIETWTKAQPFVRELFKDAFDKWLKEKGLEASAKEKPQVLMKQFLIETYAASFKEMKNFIKGFGTDKPITDQNMSDDLPLTIMRDNYDYVDNHYYWDHPRFAGKGDAFPHNHSNKSAIREMIPALSHAMPTRISGKPFTVTEFNTPYPNMFRADSGIIAGAYASLQGWDATYRFAVDYGRDVAFQKPLSLFNTSTDPSRFLSERAAALFFLRGDVKEASAELPILLAKDMFEKEANPLQDYPATLWKLGFVMKTATVVYGDGYDWSSLAGKACVTLGSKAPAGLPGALAFKNDATAESFVAELKKRMDFQKGEIDFARKYARSSTGEIEENGSAGTLKVVTPRSEALCVCDKGAISGGVLSVDNKSSAACFFAGALDDKPLKESSRILILHLTDVQNSMTKFSSQDMTVYETRGKLPLLARRGVADFTLRLTKEGPAPKIYILDLSGRRVAEAKSKFSEDGTLSFTADVFESDKTPAFAYELIR